MTRSKDGRFDIVEHQRDDDSYMYSDTDYTYYLVSVETGDELKVFSGRWNQRADGDEKSGVSSLSFGPDGTTLVVKEFDGPGRTEPLPRAVRLVRGGHAIEITWPDGRVEERGRRQVTLFMKSGRMVDERPLIGLPGTDPTARTDGAKG